MARNTIQISVLGDVKGFQKSMQQVQKDLGKLGTLSNKAGAFVGKSLKVAGAGALVAATGVAVFGKSAIDAASDAQQSLGATEAIFGKFADTVIKKSDKAAEAYGLSANQYRESTNLLGALFKNQGVAMEDLAGTTDTMIKKAADLAAMYGGTVGDSVEALTAAYKGEYNQLEKYGITLNQTMVAEEMKRRGLDKLTGASKRAAEQQVKTDLIFKQSKDATGALNREYDTYASTMQRLNAKFEDFKVKIGTALMPVVSDLLTILERDGMPILEDFAKWFEKEGPQAIDKAVAKFREFWPVVRDTLVFIGNNAGTIAKLVAAFYALTTVIAIVNPLVTAGKAVWSGYKVAVDTVIPSIKNFNTNVDGTNRAMSKLGGAARIAGGAAGIGLLIAGLNEADKSVGAFETTLGGAALGFSVGGPWGAAIGAAGGALVGLAGAFDDTKKSTYQAKASVDDYIATLDSLTGATTQATKALIYQDLQKTNALDAARALGISERDLVGAVLGHEGAQKRVNKAMEVGRRNGKMLTLENGGQVRASDALRQTLTGEGDALDGLTDKYKDAHREKQREILATGNLKKALKGLPKKVITDVKTNGVPTSRKEVLDLAKKYRLTPKEVKTLFKAVGIKPVKKDADDVQNKLKDTGNVKPNINPWKQHLLGDLRSTKGQTKKGTDEIDKTLGNTGKGVKGDFKTYLSSITNAVSTGKSTASGGSHDIGYLLGAGMPSGFDSSGAFSALAARAVATVQNAIAAARAAADVHSPSRKTAYIGRMMGLGLRNGWDDGATKFKAGVQKVIKQTLGILKRRGADKKQMAKYNKWLDDFFQKNRKTTNKHIRKVTEINKRLAKAEDVLARRRDIRKSYKESIAQGIKQYASLSNLNSAFNADAMLKQMRARVDKVKAYNKLLLQLMNQGLNKDMVDQLAQAGVEGGLAYAQAIAQGGPAAIKQFNELQSELDTVSNQIGTRTADYMYEAGVMSAQGMVKGLRSQRKAIIEEANAWARALVKAIKKQLGIKSPSRVFARLGEQTVQGMEVGLKNTKGVEQATINLAKTMVNAYDVPKLKAEATLGTPGGGTGGNTYNITVTAPATVDKAALGRELVGAIDAYERKGGRKRA